MILKIDTTQGHDVEIGVYDDDKKIADKKFNAQYSQAEKLLSEISKLLKKKKIKLDQIKKIKVENRGGTFTALRIGVVTANALGYALGVPMESVGALGQVKERRGFNIVEPLYEGEPNITKKKER